MTKFRNLALGSITLTALLMLSGVAGAQQGMVKLKTLKPDEFKQIHGTTDRYELMSMEVKGDCTQCHERRTETEISGAAGILLRSKSGGGETLRPYDKLDSHAIGEIDVFHRDPAWGTVNFLGQYLGGKYHSADAEIRYQSIVDAVFTSRLYPRNAEHLLLPPATPETPVPLFNPDDQNPGTDYRKDISEQIALLRVGPQSFPAHLRLTARRYAVKGDQQQQFLDESGTPAQNCTNNAGNCHDMSYKRDVNTVTAGLQAGADTHLGYAGLAYTFDYVEFRDDVNDPEFNFSPIPGVDPGGVSAHNTTPDGTQMEHTITANTMSSGTVAAWGSFMLGDRKNEDTGIDEVYYKSMADATWRPFGWMSVAAKYRRSYRKDDADNGVQNLRLAAGLPTEYGTTVDRYMGVLTVQPLQSLTLRGDFTHKEEQRDDAEGFGQPGTTRTNAWKLAATYHPARPVTVRGSYDGLHTDDNPAFNTSASDSRRLQAWASAQLTKSWLVFANWTSIAARNRFSDFENDQTNLQGGFNWVPGTGEFSLSGFFSRFGAQVNRDQGSFPANTFLLVRDGVSYEALGTQYLLQAAWRATEQLTFKAECGLVKAEGTMDADPTDLGQWTDFNATQKDLSLDGAYEFQNGWGLSARLAHSRYDQDDTENGDEKVTEGQLTLSKRW